MFKKDTNKSSHSTSRIFTEIKIRNDLFYILEFCCKLNY